MPQPVRLAGVPDTLRNASLREAPERAPLWSAVDALLAICPRPGSNVAYAVAYASGLHGLLCEQAPDNALTIQCRYILGNITHWRHPDAPAVRSILKGWINAR